MKAIMTKEELVGLSTAELLVWYNENSEQTVKRFADRKTAERRCLSLLEEVVALDAGISIDVDTDSTAEPAAKKTLTMAEALKPKAKKEAKEAPAPDATRQKMSEAQRRAWQNKEVYEARCERSAVEVDGEEYKSVRQAFQELGLPLQKHIAFRGRLKEAGKLTEFGHKWEIVPLNY